VAEIEQTPVPASPEDAAAETAAPAPPAERGGERGFGRGPRGRRPRSSGDGEFGDKGVGVGLGKGSEVADAIKKGGELAKRNMVPVALKDATIPHEIYCQFDGAKVLLRPASPGTGIIAGKTVRAVLESAGIKDVLTKSLGSKNAANVVKCTLKALLKLRLAEDIYAARGLKYVKRTEAPVVSTPVTVAN
jgi:small subunit ribosomal protein S5